LGCVLSPGSLPVTTGVGAGGGGNVGDGELGSPLPARGAGSRMVERRRGGSLSGAGAAGEGAAVSGREAGE